MLKAGVLTVAVIVVGAAVVNLGVIFLWNSGLLVSLILLFVGWKMLMAVAWLVGLK